MQLTIDSSQPLDDVLRVIGAMYNVNLEVPATNGRAATRAVQRERRRPGTRRSKVATTAEVRAWAQSHGYEVGSKGRIADSVVKAYRAAK